MRKIKVAEVITRLDWGGSPDIVRIICAHLDPDIFEVRLIAGLTCYPSVKTREFLGKFEESVSVVKELQRDINPFRDLCALFKLYRLMRKEKFDIIHTHTAKAGAIGRIAARLAGVKRIVHTPHGHNFYGYFGPLLSMAIIIFERLISKVTDRIIVFTELEKTDFIKYKVAEGSKITVINQGLELEKYFGLRTDKLALKKALRIEPKDLVIGMIGRLEPIKGINYLVEGAKDIVKQVPNVKFLIVGQGSLRVTLEERANELGLKNKFIFAGWREDIPEIISILDLLVLPSLNEAVGMALIEAQAGAVAVVASCVGGIPEVVKNQETGILVRPKDSKAISMAVNLLLADKEKRVNMGQSGKEWVRNKFNTEVMCGKISGLYKDISND